MNRVDRLPEVELESLGISRLIVNVSTIGVMSMHTKSIQA